MRPSRRRCFFLALPALLAAALPAQSKPLPADRARGVESVTLAHTKEWLGQLASEAFGGRGTGQDGFQLAADYVALHFKTVGAGGKNRQLF